MAATDARPVPIKGAAYRVTFPILDGTGALVSGAAGLDSEISQDGGTFADCTNEATQIASSSGMYYLDLTASEMTADTVAVIVKTSTSGAKTTPLVLYPQEPGDIRVDLQSVAGASLAATGAIPELGIVHRGTAQAVSSTTLTLASAAAFADDTLIGTTVAAYGSTQGYWQVRRVLDNVGATDVLTVDAWTVTPSGTVTYIVFATPPDSATRVLDVNVAQISGDATAADNLESILDGTGGTLHASLTGSVDSVTDPVSVDALSAGAVDAVWDESIEVNVSARQSMRLHNAALAGKASGLNTTTAIYRDMNDSKDRITATVDGDGNRALVVVDMT